MRSLRTRKCVAALGLAAVLGLPWTASAQTYNVHFITPSVSGQAGGTVTVRVGLDNQPEAVTAFSFGIQHDAEVLTVESVEIAADLQSVLGAGNTPDERFYNVETDPAGGTGVTIGLILSSDSATTTAIPPGLGHRLYNLRYRIADTAEGSTTVEISGSLGSPAVPVILDLEGVSQEPVGGPPAPVTTATVNITEGPVPFRRGDVNQSGRLEITDAILILDYLVGGSRLPAGEPTRTNCVVAMNVNGDTRKGNPDVEDNRDIDLTDPIVLLQYVFDTVLDPPPPATPFPQCGASEREVDESISCNDFNCG